ncbi:MAG: anhydro-N-acetylmuramic acid kinase [Bacteroidales bacterium]|nr:anhydro-N-acetylmuramic acid kinase [Bacteroidales bacterium]
MQKYYAVGIMSGTSLDGLDIVFCKYNHTKRWAFKIIKAETISYDKSWKEQLKNAESLSGLALTKLHKKYGRFIGEKVNQFLHGINEKPDLIASHGHTVFHQPEHKITLQIGDGAEIASLTGVTTISDFRPLDVALGGQGAPLVPIGDEFLFHEYDYCLNIGGFANISMIKNHKRVAFDICPANIVLNHLANKLNKPFDIDGKAGQLGATDSYLLNQLNQIDFYQRPYPKSLGKEWVDEFVLPVLNHSAIHINDQISTFYDHISDQITKVISDHPEKKVLLTGGGAYNKYLIERIRAKTKSQIIIPPKNIIEYKEALIFGLLGILRLNRKINCLSTVTGAKVSSSSGIIHLI